MKNKLHRYFVACGLILNFTGHIQAAPSVWPMPAELPSVPPGEDSATYPMPRLDWVQRVKNNNEKAQAQASAIQLVFDGDSITDAWQSKGREIWDARYARFNAFDFGISGDRTEHLLWRLSQGQVADLHPKLIALMIGTNNMGANTVEQIAGGVQAVVADYRQRCPDAVILLQAIFPRGHEATDPVRTKIKAVNQIISKLDDGHKVIYVDFGDKFLEADGTLSPEIMPDFLHPNAKGYQIWAEAIQPFIDKYLGKS